MEKEKLLSEVIEVFIDFEINLKNSGIKDEKSEKLVGKMSVMFEVISF